MSPQATVQLDRPSPPAAGPPRRALRWRLLAAIVTAAILIVGVYGTFTYLRAYDRYRGFAPPQDPPGVIPGRLVHIGFFSEALDRQRGYYVYEPPGYQQLVDSGKRLPVLYLLHGSPGMPINFILIGNAGVQLDVLLHRHTIKPMLLVMPDGTINGNRYSDTEWANTSKVHYESALVDVIHDVDSRFPTLRSRLDRGLAGYSEGAYASINFTLHHLDLVSIAESWSGYFTQPGIGPFVGAPPEELVDNSPALYLDRVAKQVRKLPLSVFIFSGVFDPATPVGQAFAAHLANAGAHVVANAYPGAHDWRLWRHTMPISLQFADQFFGLRKRGPSSLTFVSAATLAQQRAQYEAKVRQAEIDYCHRHGVSSRSYCPAVLGLVPTPTPTATGVPVMLSLTLLPPDSSALQAGGVLRGTLASDQPADVTITATIQRRRHIHGRRGHRARFVLQRIIVGDGNATLARAGVVPVELVLTPEGRSALRGRAGTDLVLAATVRSSEGALEPARLSVRVGR